MSPHVVAQGFFVCDAHVRILVCVVLRARECVSAYASSGFLVVAELVLLRRRSCLPSPWVQR